MLLDSGGTLVRPRGGRWNPRHDFEEVLQRHHLAVSDRDLAPAFAGGEALLRGAITTPSRDDYHRAILDVLGIDASSELLSDLDAPLDVPPVELFPDAAPIVRELRARGVRLALLTDNWGDAASWRRTYDRLGLRGVFDAVVVSLEVGFGKPDPRSYAAASDGLGLEPKECLFVDDDPALVDAAIHLGYGGRVIARTSGARPTGTPSVKTLDEILPLVG